MHLVSYYNVFLLIGVHLRNMFELDSSSSSVGSVCPSYRMMTQDLPYDIPGSKQTRHSKSTNDCPYEAERECNLQMSIELVNIFITYSTSTPAA